MHLSLRSLVHFSIKIFFILILTPLFSLADVLLPVSGRVINESDILPADVFSRVELVRAELKLIRKELGDTSFPTKTFHVLETAPREVYFMANALFDRSNRLAFEYNKTTEDNENKFDAAAIKPYHVWLMVNQAYERIQSVKNSLNIVENVIENTVTTSTSPSDVIQAMFKANQELDNLLSKKVSPADVFQQVTLAVNLSAQLLAHFKEVDRIPTTPDMIRFKSSEDVYVRLTHCFSLIRNIAKLSNKEILTFDASSIGVGVVNPGDVYSLATLLVAELSYFHALLPHIDNAAQAFFPGRKTPSHVFQRVGLLEAQLDQLLNVVKKNPQWISINHE